MGALLEVLCTVEFLASLPQEALVRFMLLGRARHHARADSFWREGDPASELIFPITGEAKAVSRDTAGRELIHRVAAPGSCLGIAGALDGLPHTHAAEVMLSGEFFAIARVPFLRFLAADDVVREGAVRYLSSLYRASLLDRVEIAFEPVSRRIARVLLRSACARQGDGARLLLAGSRTEIAARVASVPEVVTRTLKRLADSGVLLRTPRAYFVADWDRLREIAGAPSQPEADSLERTRAHFLARRSEQGTRPVSEEAMTCRGHLRDLAACREKGCPVALADPLSAWIV